jgi:hypothetical protein
MSATHLCHLFVTLVSPGVCVCVTQVVSAAHSVGLPTTSTIMFGSIEPGPAPVATHLLRLRGLAAATGGVSEFVPLPFVHMEAPIYLKVRRQRQKIVILMHTLLHVLVLHVAALQQQPARVFCLHATMPKRTPSWLTRSLLCTTRAPPPLPLQPPLPPPPQGRARRGPTLRECLLLHAVARLVLHPLVTNIQVGGGGGTRGLGEGADIQVGKRLGGGGGTGARGWERGLGQGVAGITLWSRW